ncbi:MAG: hypothetical protein ACHQF0_01530 [Chitinophagales bacterium]
MSNENPNDNLHWRNKLGDLEHVPGEAFNKDAAWNTLHERLQGKHGSKKVFWYWIAAACLICVLMIAFVNYYKGSSKRLNDETAIRYSDKTDNSKSMADKKNRDENMNMAVPLKNKIAGITRKSYKKDHPAVSPGSVSHARFNDTGSIHLQDPAVRTLQVVDVTSIAATILPSKKKLNVVYINELGDPVEESRDIVHRADKHSFKLKFAKEEVFVNPSNVSKTTGFAILKTKPFSN